MLKFCIFFQESPYPARHGGTIDMLRRLEAFHSIGFEISIIFWHSDPSSQSCRDSVDHLAKYAKEIHVYQYNQTISSRLKYLAFYFRFPAPVCTRLISKNQLNQLKAMVQLFKPDYILQDGLMSGYLAQTISDSLDIPLLVRSHNIEHLYWLRQLKTAKFGLYWLKCLLRLTSIRKFETNGLKKAKYFFDISVDDLSYWRSLGYLNGKWLPPLISTEHLQIAKSAEHKTEKPFHICFVGNLRMPNNISGLTWFFDEVLPILKSQLGFTPKCLIAGSSPVTEIIELQKKYNFELIANFDTLEDIFSQAHACINPMLVGSGVAMKTIDMMLSGLPIVTSSQGCSGLPSCVKNLLFVADNAHEFSQKITDIFSEHFDHSSQKQIEVVTQNFSVSIVSKVMQNL